MVELKILGTIMKRWGNTMSYCECRISNLKDNKINTSKNREKNKKKSENVY